MLNWQRVTKWLIGKLTPSWFQNKLEIVEVCLENLSDEEKETYFENEEIKTL